MVKKILSIVAVVLVCAGLTCVYAADGVKVCVLPFTVNSQEKIDYLSRALPDMVATRLEKPGEIIAVPKPVVAKALVQLGWKGFTEQGARAIGRAVGADFVVGGTLTKIGKAASIDAAIIDMSGKRPLQRVYLTADDTADLPGSMQDLARRLSFVILNRDAIEEVVYNRLKLFNNL